MEALGAEWFPMQDLKQEVDWTEALKGVYAVVHLAGLAHRFESRATGEWMLYDRVNHLSTRSLASSLQGHPSVRRFLFASTARVHGDTATLPIREESPINPQTPYDKSKADAEASIRELLSPHHIHWAILRPVLVYGPGNRGNMSRLAGLLSRGIPVPLGRTLNRRSFLFVGNLVDAIQTYLQAPTPVSGRTWMIADKEVASTEELILAMARAMQVNPRILRLPDGVLEWSARFGSLINRLGFPMIWNEDVRRKLLGDFYVDASLIQDELVWKPPFTMEEGIQITFRGSS